MSSHHVRVPRGYHAMTLPQQLQWWLTYLPLAPTFAETIKEAVTELQLYQRHNTLGDQTARARALDARR